MIRSVVDELIVDDNPMKRVDVMEKVDVFCCHAIFDKRSSVKGI